jgi:DNA-binding NarL/FixJ family response regulator
MDTSTSSVRRVLILNTDRMCSAGLVQTTRRVFPDAEIAVVHRVACAKTLLEGSTYDILVSGTVLSDGDIFEVLAWCEGRESPVRHILVVVEEVLPALVEKLRATRIAGVFDASGEDGEALGSALLAVMEGKAYWSTSTFEECASRMPFSRLSRILTPGESIMLVLMGAGADDRSVAQQLRLRPASVKAVRRQLHQKLGVQHKGELMCFAAMQGIVRFTAAGVRCPGLALMLEQWHGRKQRRVA